MSGKAIDTGTHKFTPDSYTETPIRILVEMKLFRSQYCTKQKIVFLIIVKTQTLLKALIDYFVCT